MSKASSAKCGPFRLFRTGDRFSVHSGDSVICRGVVRDNRARVLSGGGVRRADLESALVELGAIAKAPAPPAPKPVPPKPPTVSKSVIRRLSIQKPDED